MTGITASMPMALTLIEAIASRDKAEAVARDLGLTHWDARHDSKAFTLTRPFVLTVLGNRLAFWQHEQLGMALAPGGDEVSLALVADAWSHTYRSVARGDVRRHGRCAADPPRHPHRARSRRRALARGAAAAGDRGPATGRSIESGPARHRGPLRQAYRRPHRHAARIPEGKGTAVKRPRGMRRSGRLTSSRHSVVGAQAREGRCWEPWEGQGEARKTSRLTEEPIADARRLAASGMPGADVCRPMGIAEATCDI
jgi:hypothetical protein